MEEDWLRFEAAQTVLEGQERCRFICPSRNSIESLKELRKQPSKLAIGRWIPKLSRSYNEKIELPLRIVN